LSRECSGADYIRNRNALKRRAEVRQEKNALEEKKIRASKKQKNGKRPLEVEKR